MKQKSTLLLAVALALAALGGTVSVSGVQAQDKQAPGPGKPPKGQDASHANPPQSEPKLELVRLRSEGTAQFESGVGLKKALAAFEAALKISPDSAIDLHNIGTTQRKLGNADLAQQLLTRAVQAKPALAHPAYTLGLVYRGKGDSQAAIAAFETARTRAPTEPSVHYQLGRLYREVQRDPQALQAFIDALQLDPQHTGSMYQLYLYYQEKGETDRAKAMFEEFSRVKRALSLTRKELNDDESVLARPFVVATAPQPREVSAPALSFTASKIVDSDQITSFDVRDFDGDGLEDVFAGTRGGTIRVLRNEGKLRFAETATLKLEGGAPVTSLHGEMLVRGESFRLIAISGGSLFVSNADVTKAAAGSTKLSTSQAPAQISFADLDHDGDLDLIVNAFRDVLLNDGAGAFQRAQYLPAQAGKDLAKLSGPIVGVDIQDRNAIDFVVHGAGGERLLLVDALGGRHATQPFTKLSRVGKPLDVNAADLDNDGGVDLVTVGGEAVEIDYHQQMLRFTPSTLPLQLAAPKSAALGDFDNDGWKDLMVFADGAAPQLLRNAGGRKFNASAVNVPASAVAQARSVVADMDGDGRLDVVTLLKSGALQALHNDSRGIGRATRVALTGIRSAPSSLHTIVEVRRGNFYEKYVSDGRTLHLPLGSGDYAEIVRINWPNGFVETKMKVDADQRATFKESERVSGSCPSVFAWDGTRFNFITDAFISGPMGVPMGQGRYFPVDHDEYVKIPGGKLRSIDGRLRIAITEELREAVFLDRARLIAVDHPVGTELYPNEYLKAGDFPEYKLHLTATARAPVRAVDHRGVDVTDLVRAADRRYPTGFSRLQYDGLAEPNGVEFDLPAGAVRASQLRLFLTGWFHYFESTSLVAASQRRDLSVQWPQIEAWSAGQWQPVMTIGIPSGKDKTVVADLSGRVPPDAQRLRVRSNLALYWDRIAIDTQAAPEQVATQQLGMNLARLRFRGFSAFEHVSAAQMPQPERFVYHAMRFAAPWNPLIGRYTRYGGVDELLGEVDSLMTVFGSGDELLLEFDADGLKPPRAGWQRDYLLHLDGYVKDGDKYTAHAGQLEPIPYAGMAAYPYDDPAQAERIFASPQYRDYLARYQTRLPLRFTGPALSPEAPARLLGASLTGAAARMQQ